MSEIIYVNLVCIYFGFFRLQTEELYFNAGHIEIARSEIVL